MMTFVMLSKIAPGAYSSSKEFKDSAAKIRKMLEKEVPAARWICSYALLGAYDVIDIFEAPDMQHASMVSSIVRMFARAETETMLAENWQKFVAKAGSATA